MCTKHCFCFVLFFQIRSYHSKNIKGQRDETRMGPTLNTVDTNVLFDLFGANLCDENVWM